jgi:phenylacetate-CoA ligase
VALLSFLRQILSCANLGVNKYRFGWYGIDFNSSYQARFYGIPMDFIGNKKNASRIFEPSVSISDFRFIRCYLKDAEKFQYKSLITLMVIPVLLFYLLNIYKEKYCLTTICPTLKVCMVTSEMLLKTTNSF